MIGRGGTAVPSTAPRAALVDRLAARSFGLPPPQAVRVHPVRIPLRDRVTLLGDHYEPVGESLGVLLSWGPYGRGMLFSFAAARPYAARGYHVVLVSSRGTGGSEGNFDPMRTEAQDGRDIVAWLRQQPWFPGRFGTVGGSYLGYTQWSLLTDPPPELATAVIAVGPHDISRHTWGTGTFNLDLIGWSDTVAHGGLGLAAMLRLLGAQRRLRPVLSSLPMADAADRYFDGRAPWVRPRLEQPDLTDPYWAPVQHAEALEQVTVPVLLVSGWQDLFMRQTFEQYRRLRERGVPVALSVGPWSHTDRGLLQCGLTDGLDWLGDHLAHRSPSTRATPVRIFVTGADAWRDLEAWPPQSTSTRLHLHPNGALRDSTPTVDGPPSTFVYDPADPTPTLGGPVLTNGGYVDDGPLAERLDVVCFTGSPLRADTEVVGTIVAHIVDRTEHPDADLFVRVSDLDERGRSRNVTEGYCRLDPARGDQPVELRLSETAHRFRRGHRIRVLVAGGSFPHYARNLGTGENPVTGPTFVTNRHEIVHADGASWVELPTI
jgi:putative CocE/NonD family hydrolase